MARKKGKTEPEPEQPTLEERVTRLEQAIDGIIGVIRAGLIAQIGQGEAAKSVAGQVTQAFRSGRWHLRDGDRYGKPPLYADHSGRNLRSPDKR